MNLLMAYNCCHCLRLLIELNKDFTRVSLPQAADDAQDSIVRVVSPLERLARCVEALETASNGMLSFELNL